MKVYVEGEIPKTCDTCNLSDRRGYCIANNSKYYFWKNERPYWCPIEEL